MFLKIIFENAISCTSIRPLHIHKNCFCEWSKYRLLCLKVTLFTVIKIFLWSQNWRLKRTEQVNVST